MTKKPIPRHGDITPAKPAKMCKSPDSRFRRNFPPASVSYLLTKPCALQWKTFVSAAFAAFGTDSRSQCRSRGFGYPFIHTAACPRAWVGPRLHTFTIFDCLGWRGVPGEAPYCLAGSLSSGEGAVRISPSKRFGSLWHGPVLKGAF